MTRLFAHNIKKSPSDAGKSRANGFFSKMLPVAWRKKSLLAEETQLLRMENADLGKTIDILRGENRELIVEFNQIVEKNQLLKAENADLGKTIDILRWENRELASEFNKLTEEKQRLMKLQSVVPVAQPAKHAGNAQSAGRQGEKYILPERVPPPEAAFLEGMP